MMMTRGALVIAVLAAAAVPGMGPAYGQDGRTIVMSAGEAMRLDHPLPLGGVSLREGFAPLDALDPPIPVPPNAGYAPATTGGPYDPFTGRANFLPTSLARVNGGPVPAIGPGTLLRGGGGTVIAVSGAALRIR